MQMVCNNLAYMTILNLSLHKCTEESFCIHSHVMILWMMINKVSVIHKTAGHEETVPSVKDYYII